jgi:hypothetical protein
MNEKHLLRAWRWVVLVLSDVFKPGGHHREWLGMICSGIMVHEVDEVMLSQWMFPKEIFRSFKQVFTKRGQCSFSLTPNFYVQIGEV